MISTQVFIVISNYLVYEKEVTNVVVVECIVGILYQFFNLFMIHVSTNLVGLLYVEAEILRSGNDKLLNEMSEGVIIMDQDNGMVLFVNNSAKSFNIY